MPQQNWTKAEWPWQISSSTRLKPPATFLALLATGRSWHVSSRTNFGIMNVTHNLPSNHADQLMS
jgi:hypothetical protein